MCLALGRRHEECELIANGLRLFPFLFALCTALRPSSFGSASMYIGGGGAQRRRSSLRHTGARKGAAFETREGEIQRI
jgi:hypothetical protein